MRMISLTHSLRWWSCYVDHAVELIFSPSATLWVTEACFLVREIPIDLQKVDLEPLEIMDAVGHDFSCQVKDPHCQVLRLIVATLITNLVADRLTGSVQHLEAVVIRDVAIIGFLDIIKKHEP